MLRAVIQTRGMGAIKPQNFRAGLKADLGETVLHWHKIIFPKHFTTQGAQEYGYTKRKAGYMRMKARRYGHQNPLVLTGESKRMMQRAIKVSGTANQARGAMQAPKGFFAIRKGSTIDKMAEATAVSQLDAAILALHLDKLQGTRIAADQSTETKTL